MSRLYFSAQIPASNNSKATPFSVIKGVLEPPLYVVKTGTSNINNNIVIPLSVIAVIIGKTLYTGQILNFIMPLLLFLFITYFRPLCIHNVKRSLQMLSQISLTFVLIIGYWKRTFPNQIPFLCECRVIDYNPRRY